MAAATVEEWTPRSGWNPTFSPQERTQCVHLFFFLKNKKGFKDSIAERITMIVLYRQKLGVTYEEEQERFIRSAIALGPAS